MSTHITPHPDLRSGNDHPSDRVAVEHVQAAAFQSPAAFIAAEGFSETPNVNPCVRLTVSYANPDNHVVVLLSLAECRELRMKLERVFLQVAISGPRASAEAIEMFLAGQHTPPAGGSEPGGER
jgi:hypothetical protein